MYRAPSFFLLGTALTAVGVTLAACGGAEFGTADPSAGDRDGAVDASASDGKGGRGGVGGSGGSGVGGSDHREDAPRDVGGAGASTADSQADGLVADTTGGRD